MEIHYINTDLEIESKGDLKPIIAAFGENVITLHHGPVKDMNRASFELTNDHDFGPDEAICKYCALVENLPPTTRRIWDKCSTRIVNIGVESGSYPKRDTFEVQQSTIHRMDSVGVSLVVTVYAMEPKGK